MTTTYRWVALLLAIALSGGCSTRYIVDQAELAQARGALASGEVGEPTIAATTPDGRATYVKASMARKIVETDGPYAVVEFKDPGKGLVIAGGILTAAHVLGLILGISLVDEPPCQSSELFGCVGHGLGKAVGIGLIITQSIGVIGGATMVILGATKRYPERQFGTEGFKSKLEDGVHGRFADP